MGKKGNNNQNHTPPRRIRTQIREQELKNAPTAHRVTAQLVLPDVSITDIIHIAETLFFCLTYYVTPAVRIFLCRRHLVSPMATNYDYAGMMQILSHYNSIDRHFLYAPIFNREIGKAISARNEICHLDLTALKKNWHRNLLTWIRLCRSVGDARAASNVQTVCNRLVRGQYQHAIEENPFYCTTGTYNESSAFGLSLLLYSCLARHVGTSLRTFLVQQKRHPSSTFDVFKNLKHIIEEQKIKSDFLATGASHRSDSILLKVAMDARNHTCHGKFSRVFSRWKEYLQTWVSLLDIINAKEAAGEIQQVLNSLVVAESDIQQVRPSRILFPRQ